MDNLIDPLKIHTQGVKKPLEHKGDKMQVLAQNNQRYYPKDAKGNLDEWGAVIKRQAEAYARDQQTQSIQKTALARQYGDELQKAMRQKKDAEDMERRNRLGERDSMLRAVAYKGL